MCLESVRRDHALGLSNCLFKTMDFVAESEFRESVSETTSFGGDLGYSRWQAKPTFSAKGAWADPGSVAGHLTAGDWQRIQSMATLVTIQQPRVILRRGKIDGDLLFLVEGNAQVFVEEHSDVVDRFVAGEFIGEMGFLNGNPSDVSVMAETGAVIARLDGEKLSKLCAEDPLFAAHLHSELARLLSRRLRRTIKIARQLGAPAPIVAPVHAINPTIRIGQFSFRALVDGEDVEEAQALLHDVYILEQGWKPLPYNPSRVRVEVRNGRRLLTDRFSREAHWFGAFHGRDLVGCFRVLTNPNLELSQYIDLPPFLANSLATELNRLAIRPDWRQHQLVMPILLQVAFEHSFKLGHVVFVTAPRHGPAELFSRLGLKSGIVPPFRYNHVEGELVELLYFDSSSECPNTTPLYRAANRLRKRHEIELPSPGLSCGWHELIKEPAQAGRPAPSRARPSDDLAQPPVPSFSHPPTGICGQGKGPRWPARPSW